MAAHVRPHIARLVTRPNTASDGRPVEAPVGAIHADVPSRPAVVALVPTPVAVLVAAGRLEEAGPFPEMSLTPKAVGQVDGADSDAAVVDAAVVDPIPTQVTSGHTKVDVAVAPVIRPAIVVRQET